MSPNNPTIVCVVVTYNRLSLLMNCIEAISRQTTEIMKIIIVDNLSTDGTAEYLKTIKRREKIQVCSMKENIGGAGGFSKGIQIAAELEPDWIWVMDDDTVPEPDALENLIQHTDLPKVGFLNSMVVWKDMTPHRMNIPYYVNQTEGPQNDIPHVREIKSASFVSLLIRGSIPKEIGLPIGEFFIWSDDAEYTDRIILHGYHGYQVTNSIALHKTPTNYCSTLENIPASAAWKLFYGERNESYRRRKNKGWFLFVLSQINTIRLHLHKINKRRDLTSTERKILKKFIIKGLLAGFIFNPTIKII